MLKSGYEFHFSKNPIRMRNNFVQIISSLEINVCYGLVNKSSILKETKSAHSREEIYLIAMKQLITNFGKESNLELIIDDTGDKRFQSKIKRGIRNQIAIIHKHYKLRTTFRKSNTENMLQLADYLAATKYKSLK